MSSTTIKSGLSGEDVKTLKSLLRGAGYSLSDDDLYDEATRSAVSDYQKNVPQPKPKGSPLSGIDPNAATKDAVSYLEKNRPGPYASIYQSRIDDLIAGVLSREDFTYDPAADPMYIRYRDEYLHQGKKAMKDALGTASSLTGGYANSFSQSAGQQAYGEYLTGLTNAIPELYSMALDAYNTRTDNMQNALSALQDAEKTAYDRYQDDADAYESALDYYYKKLMDETDEAHWQYKNAPKPSGKSAKEKTLSNILTPSEFLKRKAAGANDLKAYATYSDYSAHMHKK